MYVLCCHYSTKEVYDSSAPIMHFKPQIKLSIILFSLHIFMFEMDIRGFFSLERSKKSLKRKGGHDSEGETAKTDLAVEIMNYFSI